MSDPGVLLRCDSTRRDRGETGAAGARGQFRDHSRLNLVSSFSPPKLSDVEDLDVEAF